MDLTSVPRIKLANLPTPLERAEQLGKYLGIEQFYIKRDDLTGLALGGNKARKLEFELASVKAAGFDTVITVGGQQSNHARMTAAACRKLGIDIKLVLGGEDFSELKGNLLLDTFFEAEIRYLTGSDEDADLENMMNRWKSELIACGKNPYAMPLGGSTPTGVLGYVEAMREIGTQIKHKNMQLILPVGSCGTLAGVVLGADIFLEEAGIIGISVSRTKESIYERTRKLIDETKKKFGLREGYKIQDFDVYDNYYEVYARHIKPAKDAARVCAMTEGLIVDQVYTAKAMAGFFDLISKGIIRKESPVIFIHTGGMPEIFAETIKYGEYKGCVKFSAEEYRSGK